METQTAKKMENEIESGGVFLSCWIEFCRARDLMLRLQAMKAMKAMKAS